MSNMMKNQKTITKDNQSNVRRYLLYSALVGFLMILYSCGKEKDNPLPSLDDGVSVVIRDLPGDTEASMAEGVEGKVKRPFHTFLFNFKDKRQIWIKNKADSLRWLKTLAWDIAFTGPYNSELFVNNAKDKFNPGYEGPATNTGVVLVRQAYHLVNEAPSDEEFEKSTVSKIGWASNEYSDGWFLYSLKTHLAIPLPNRTYVIKLQDGKFAKLQIVNSYKGNPQAVTNMKWPAPYYTFRYYVQEDGSRNLNTSGRR